VYYYKHIIKAVFVCYNKFSPTTKIFQTEKNSLIFAFFLITLEFPDFSKFPEKVVTLHI